MIKVVMALLEIVAHLFCIAGLYGKRSKVNYYTVLFLGVLGVLFYGINVNDYPPILKLVAYVLIFLYCMVSYGMDIKKAVINYCLSFVCISFIEICVFMPISFALSKQEEMSIEMALLTNVLIVVVAYFISRKSWLLKLSQIFHNKKMFLIMIIITMIYLLVVFVQLARQGFIHGMDAFIIVFVGVFLGIMLYEWQKEKREVDRKENQLLMNRLYADAYEELILLVRERQHDVKNHISAMQSMIYTAKSYEELVEKQKAYCDYIVDESAMTSIVLRIENPLIAGFLYKRIKDAQKLGIEVTYDLAFSKEPLQLTEYTIVEMMGILLDNAVESVMELEEERRLSVALMRVEDKMTFRVSNPYRTKEGEEPVDIAELLSKSSKGKNRGLGVNKLKKMVKEAEGYIYIAKHTERGQTWIDISVELPLRTAVL